jgi:hypothetical protein
MGPLAQQKSSKTKQQNLRLAQSSSADHNFGTLHTLHQQLFLTHWITLSIMQADQAGDELAAAAVAASVAAHVPAEIGVAVPVAMPVSMPVALPIAADAAAPAVPAIEAKPDQVVEYHLDVRRPTLAQVRTYVDTHLPRPPFPDKPFYLRCSEAACKRKSRGSIVSITKLVHIIKAIHGHCLRCHDPPPKKSSVVAAAAAAAEANAHTMDEEEEEGKEKKKMVKRKRIRDDNEDEDGDEDNYDSPNALKQDLPEQASALMELPFRMAATANSHRALLYGEAAPTTTAVAAAAAAATGDPIDRGIEPSDAHSLNQRRNRYLHLMRSVVNDRAVPSVAAAAATTAAAAANSGQQDATTAAAAHAPDSNAIARQLKGLGKGPEVLKIICSTRTPAEARRQLSELLEHVLDHSLDDIVVTHKREWSCSACTLQNAEDTPLCGTCKTYVCSACNTSELQSQVMFLKEQREELRRELSRMKIKYMPAAAASAAAASAAATTTTTTEHGLRQECVACLDSLPSVAFIPCGHVAMCGACVFQGDSNASVVSACPMCHAPVTDTMRVFVV